MSLLGQVVLLLYKQKAELGEQPLKCLCVDYHALNSLLSPFVEAHSKAHGVLPLVHVPKFNE